MTSTSRQCLGKWGEEAAAHYLTAGGYQILDRNHRTPYGEIDIISRLENTIVFVEVKTRASDYFGLPEISVTTRKKQHMVQSAQYYIQHHPTPACLWRIDVIAIQRQAGRETPSIMHFKNVIA